MPVQTQIQVRRGTASSWTSTNPTLAAGEIGFETDTGKIKVGNGSSTWSALNYVGAANAIQYVYNATAGQTSFSGADSNGLTLSYTVGAEQVYVNGVLQVRTSDYTATNGTSVTLTTATIASDVVTIVAFGTFDIANTYTQAQANATFPLNTSSFFAGKNKIINGDFGIWQRGTNISLTNNTYAYGADRFIVYSSFSAGSSSFSQQTFAAGTAPVSGYEGTYFGRLTCGSTATYFEINQRIEDVRTFAGQTITFSFWAKASGTVVITPLFNQFFGSGGSSTVTTTGSNATLTTSWARYTATVNLPSISGKTIGTNSYLNASLTYASGTINSATIDIWGVQVEAGSVATAFQTATGTIQGELAACQRYYWREGGNSAYQSFGVGMANSTTGSQIVINLPVPMRVPATSVDFSTLALYDGVTATAVTGLSINVGSVKASPSKIFAEPTVASGLTQYRPYSLLTNNSTSGYLGFSAEL